MTDVLHAWQGEWQNGVAASWLLANLAVLCRCRLLIEHFGYQNTFLITAALKLIAYLPLIPLLAFVDDGICRMPCWRNQATPEADVEEPLLA